MGAGDGADIFAELRLDENDDRADARSTLWSYRFLPRA